MILLYAMHLSEDGADIINSKTLDLTTKTLEELYNMCLSGEVISNLFTTDYCASGVRIELDNPDMLRKYAGFTYIVRGSDYSRRYIQTMDGHKYLRSGEYIDLITMGSIEDYDVDLLDVHIVKIGDNAHILYRDMYTCVYLPKVKGIYRREDGEIIVKLPNTGSIRYKKYEKKLSELGVYTPCSLDTFRRKLLLD